MNRALDSIFVVGVTVARSNIALNFFNNTVLMNTYSGASASARVVMKAILVRCGGALTLRIPPRVYMPALKISASKRFASEMATLAGMDSRYAADS